MPTDTPAIKKAHLVNYWRAVRLVKQEKSGNDKTVVTDVELTSDEEKIDKELREYIDNPTNKLPPNLRDFIIKFSTLEAHEKMKEVTLSPVAIVLGALKEYRRVNQFTRKHAGVLAKNKMLEEYLSIVSCYNKFKNATLKINKQTTLTELNNALNDISQNNPYKSKYFVTLLTSLVNDSSIDLNKHPGLYKQTKAYWKEITAYNIAGATNSIFFYSIALLGLQALEMLGFLPTDQTFKDMGILPDKQVNTNKSIAEPTKVISTERKELHELIKRNKGATDDMAKEIKKDNKSEKSFRKKLTSAGKGFGNITGLRERGAGKKDQDPTSPTKGNTR